MEAVPGVTRVALLLVAGVGPPAALAQLPTYGVGRPPTVEEVKAWDLTIPPDGQGLPQGSGTATLGKPIYAARCASCHGEKAEDPKYRLLTGGRRTLTAAALPKNIDPLVGGEPGPGWCSADVIRVAQNPNIIEVGRVAVVSAEQDY